MQRPSGRSGFFGGANRWRAVVIPILVVLTVVAIFQVTSGPDEADQSASASAGSQVDATQGGANPGGATADGATADGAVSAGATPDGAPVAGDAQAGQTPVATPPAEPAGESPAPGAVPDLTNRDADGHVAASVSSGVIPAGPDFVASGAGTWHIVAGTTPTMGTGERRSTYTIEVEDGLQTPEQDQEFAAAVDATLADPRSWIGGGQFSLTRIDSGDPDFRISLTSQMTVRSPDQCGWEVPLEASCFNGWADRVLINDARWVRGALSFNGDLVAYRSYAVNHEVGHALGMRHQPCSGNGALAPVMMQQSWSTANNELNILDPRTIPPDGNVCVANPYPYPDAVAAAG